MLSILDISHSCGIALFPLDSLRNKAVVITGASAGIGEQMAYRYARLGARLLITARREARLKEVSQGLIQTGMSGVDSNRYVRG